ncbi:hypothetical protein [Rhizobium tubonense]|uniref:hypothetical protein n=1 Tax=Rhizobium tubonense TaxID=484088 RepID=UPI0011B7B00E|nr:hypothetical protein [Rhizobium tubonense]
MRRFQITATCLLLVIAQFSVGTVVASPPDHGPNSDPPYYRQDFERYVRTLGEAAGGDRQKLVTALEKAGFSCNPIASSIPGECVHFGCKKNGLMPNSLLQWYVGRTVDVSGKLIFSASVVDYSWEAKCIAEPDLRKSQENFLLRGNRK